MMLLPGEPMLNGVPSARMCNSLDEIEEALDEVERVHVRMDAGLPSAHSNIVHEALLHQLSSSLVQQQTLR